MTKMKRRRILVVGGVAAGPSAAAKARRCDEGAEIRLFEKGPHISYAGCGLPYYVSGAVRDRQKLLVMTPEAFRARHNVEVLTRHEVTQIDPEKKRVRVRNLKEGEERWYEYDALVLATGARPVVPPIPGVEAANVFTLRTIPDADAIIQSAARAEARSAVVVGGGLIGLEMAEALLARGLQVTIIEKMDQVLAPLDQEMALPVQKHLEEKGVRVLTGEGVEGFEVSSGAVTGVRTQGGAVLPADLVLLSVGVRPDVDLAQAAGVKLGPTGAIATGDRMQTNLEDIYAAGDCAESRNRVTGEAVWAPLGSVANRHGRTAGANAAGAEARFGGVLGSGVVKVCDLTAAWTGLSEREARARGLRVEVSHVHPLNRAHCYPEAKPLAIKLVVNAPDGRLLGAQAIGREGTDKRIDVLATAIYNGMTAHDLFDVDLAYAPPFAPAKDPVAVAGIVAGNTVDGEVRNITPGDLKRRLDAAADLVLVDVRTQEEYRAGHLPGALNIPLEELRQRCGELWPDRETVVYCRQGLRGYLAARILMQKGFSRVFNLGGGTLTWPYGLVR